MTLVGLFTIMLSACAGPMPMERAIRAADGRTYDALLERIPGATPKQAFLRWRASQRGLAYEEVVARDEVLTRNPFTVRDENAVSFGALIYGNQCLSCHGVEAAGDGPSALPAFPPHNFRAFGARAAIALNGGPSDGWFETVLHGSGERVDYAAGRSRAMPAFDRKLSREQIWMVLTYLATSAAPE